MKHNERPSNKWTQRSSGHRIGDDKHFTLQSNQQTAAFFKFGRQFKPAAIMMAASATPSLAKLESRSLFNSLWSTWIHLDPPPQTIWQIFQLATKSADVVKKGFEILKDTSEQRNPQGILQPCAKGSGRENSNQHHNLVQVVSQQSPPCPPNMRLHDISFLKAIGLSVGKRQIRPNHCLSQLRPGHCGVQGVENEQRKNVSKCVDSNTPT